MTTITIVKGQAADEAELYWAIAPDARCQAPGRTPGEALDRLNQQIGLTGTTTLVIHHQERDINFSQTDVRFQKSAQEDQTDNFQH